MLELQPSSEELKLANEIFQNCSLEGVTLIKSSVEAQGYGAELKKPYSMVVEQIQTTKAFLNKNQLVTIVNFSVCSKDSSEDPNIVFKVDGQYQLLYRLEGDTAPSPDSIQAFSKGNPIYNCWPYLREWINNTAFHVGHTPPPLPLLKIRPKTATP